jgi:hypothetical protein
MLIYLFVQQILEQLNTSTPFNPSEPLSPLEAPPIIAIPESPPSPLSPPADILAAQHSLELVRGLNYDITLQESSPENTDVEDQG